MKNNSKKENNGMRQRGWTHLAIARKRKLNFVVEYMMIFV